MNHVLEYPNKPTFNLKKKNKIKEFPYPRFTLTKQLTEEQLNFFDKHGFIHFKDFISKEIVKSIVDSSIEVQNKWLEQKLEKVNGVPIKFGVDIDGSPIVQRFAFLSQYSAVLNNLLKDIRFQALLPLLGKEARMGLDEKDGTVLNHYINSDSSKFTKMGWHTDCLRDVFYGKKVDPMLNVGIHLNDLHPDNGGLRIIPGTHKQGLFGLMFKKLHFLDNKPDKNEIAIVPSAGDLTVHDGRLWHRVAQSNIQGEVSRRRVIYIPLITGEYNPKDENSKTLLYQRFHKIVK